MKKNQDDDDEDLNDTNYDEVLYLNGGAADILTHKMIAYSFF